MSDKDSFALIDRLSPWAKFLLFIVANAVIVGMGWQDVKATLDLHTSTIGDLKRQIAQLQIDNATLNGRLIIVETRQMNDERVNDKQDEKFESFQQQINRIANHH